MGDSSIPISKYVFREGDYALVIDRRGRRYLATIKPSLKFESHLGAFLYDDLIGKEDGTWMVTNRGHHLMVVKPTMADFTVEMPRIATVNYPKDLGAILIYGDIFPGARVVEAGCGSGAMTMTLLRAIGRDGELISYDLRKDMIKRAEENVSVMIPDHPNLTFKLGDINDGIEESDVDRIVLDLPEPWHVVPHAADKLVPGGIFVSFLPTVLQVHELAKALREQRTFEMIETFEVLMRPWTVTGRSVRPSHRMVGHTGFITTSRKCAPRPNTSASEDMPEDADSAD